ncbi:MAG TPA: hypothetical protein VFS55_17465, partial [Dokdonella sp.]|nr:hypothetical protein [Dokdonella sp.]
MPAVAGIAYDALSVDAPYRGYPATVYAFAPVPGALDAASSMIFIGDAGAQGQSESSALGYIGGVLGAMEQVAPPIVADIASNGVAVAGAPEPIVVVAGERHRAGAPGRALQVFAGNPLAWHATRQLTPYDQVMSVALTRVASADDFDAAIGGVTTVALFRGQATSPAWQEDGPADALAHLPATGPQPDRLVVAGNEIDIRAVADGHLLWSWTAAGGRKVLVGNIAGSTSPEFVVLGDDHSVAAFDADAPALRWRKLGVSANDIALGDRNGDGVMEVLVATTDGHLYWLDGNGDEQGANVALTYSEPRIAVAKIDAAPARVLVLRSGRDGGGFEARSLDLATQVADAYAQSGPFDRILMGDADGDGHDELVSLANIPSGDSGSLGSSSRISIRDLDTGALRWRSSIPAEPGPGGSDAFL